MNNIKKFDEFNEGFRNKLATVALGAALTIGAPSCNINDKNIDIEFVENDLSDTYKIDDFKKYKINDLSCIFNKNEDVISTNYTILGKTFRSTISVDSNVDEIYYNYSFFGDLFKATTDKKYKNNKEFEKLILKDLKIIEDNSQYKILKYKYYKIFINKNYKPEKTFNIDGTKYGICDDKIWSNGDIFVFKMK